MNQASKEIPGGFQSPFDILGEPVGRPDGLVFTVIRYTGVYEPYQLDVLAVDVHSLPYGVRKQYAYSRKEVLFLGSGDYKQGTRVVSQAAYARPDYNLFLIEKDRPLQEVLDSFRGEE